MNYRCIAAAILLSTAGLTTPAVSWAQGTTDEATTTMARARFKEGVAYYDKGQFELARASFLQAYALKKHPAILLNLAWSCLKSGHALDGAHYFKQFLSDSPDATDKQRADANDGLSQARAKLGQVEVIGAPGLEVTIDGEHVGTTPLSEPVLVEIGSHAVHVRAPDGTTDMQSVTLLGGEKGTARFHIAAAPPPPAPTAPPIAVAPVPQPVVAPAPPLPAPPPQPVVVQPPLPPVQEAPKPVEPTPNEPPAEHVSSDMPLWPSFVGLGLTAASVVVGVVALSSVGSAQNNANEEASKILGVGGSCPPVQPVATGDPNQNQAAMMQYQQLVAACNTYSNDNNLVRVDKTVGAVSLSVGGALLAGSIVYLVVATVHNAHSGATPASQTQAAVIPLVGPSLSGLAVAGTF
jgi:hypothetical protein